MRTRRTSASRTQEGSTESDRSRYGSRDGTRADPPVSFSEFCRLVQDRKVRLPRRLAEVAKFLIANPENVAFEPLAQVASKAKLSPSAFVRLAQKLGFVGFSQLQALFERRLLGDGTREIDSDGDALTRVAAVLGHSIRQFSKDTDRAMLGRAVDLIQRAATVFVVARPDEAITVLCLRHALSASGIRSIPAGGVFGPLDEAIAFASPEDVVIFVDLPPYDRALAARIARLRSHDIPTLMITDSRLHPSILGDTVWFELRDDGPPGLTSNTTLTCLAWAIAGEVGRRRSTTANASIA